ncbi:hypothetical protein FIBSPDRAFT_791328 [Athelia psychrophila]|uniref:Mitochondrial K+-H+ exchange-related-domain-containing protein n=1 Tax=Athelia psychrophila TaxID=1759441 RepID=A0A166HJB9_9AGAM|nr:hypothetical protein FIBSPDRAFT_791328 [Fibularhizoctonia sp. CBS 109695]
MSVARKAMRPLRIIALPLTRPAHLSSITSSSTNAGATRTPLTYYQFQLKTPVDKTEEKEGRIAGYVTWGQGKAADMWASWGKAPPGNWKSRVFNYGERLVDRIDFEELALHGVDPSLGPSLAHPDFSGKHAKGLDRTDGKGHVSDRVTIPLLYAPFAYPSATISTTPHPSILQLRSLLAQRTPRHRKGFYSWMIIAPFTAPFMIIPVIPNLPFFFCVWRSWSHYKAYRASQYLEALIDNGTIVPEESRELQQVQASYEPPEEPSTATTATTTPSPTSETSASASNNLLLKRSAIPPLLSAFGLKESVSTEIYRALDQARLRNVSRSNAKAP